MSTENSGEKFINYEGPLIGIEPMPLRFVGGLP